ncbi:hypothetical protein ACXR0M_02390 [Pseudomonas sp. Eth.TT006]
MAVLSAELKAFYMVARLGSSTLAAQKPAGRGTVRRVSASAWRG